MQARLMALGALGLSGCSAVCRGPGCADSYSAERLAVLTFRDDLPSPVDPWRDADARYDGTELEGTDWVARAGPPGSLFVGMPEAGRVVRLLDAEGRVGLAPVLDVVGPEGFGASVELADLDGDGVRDLIVGAPGVAFAAGAVFVFLGGGVATGTLSSADANLIVHGTSPSDELGATIEVCADLTGDGLPELALPAPWLAVPRTRPELVPALAGGVFVLPSEVLRTSRGDVEPWDLGQVYWGDATGDSAGAAVTCRGDLTGDRRSDLAIGAPLAGASGRVYLLFTGEPTPEGLTPLRASGPLSDVADAFLVPGAPDAWFGSALATGEFEVDRTPPLELLVGAPGAHDGSGRVEIYRGADLLSGRAWRVIRNASDRTEPDHLGRGVLAGDFDGDGLDDLWIAAPDWYAGGNAYDAGALFGWSGVSVELVPNFTVGSASWTVAGTEPFQRVGRAADLVALQQDAPGTLLIPTRAAP